MRTHVLFSVYASVNRKGVNMAATEHLSGHVQFHDVLRDQYLYNGVVIRTSTSEARLTVASGVDGVEGESLVSGERETILFLWNVIQALRRQQYRQSPPRGAPKPGVDAEQLRPCRNCGGEGYVHVWDVIAECAVCRGTGRMLL